MTPAKNTIKKAEEKVLAGLDNASGKSVRDLFFELRNELKKQGIDQETFALAVYRLLNREDVHLNHERKLVRGSKPAPV